jgi:outer membrane protein
VATALLCSVIAGATPAGAQESLLSLPGAIEQALRNNPEIVVLSVSPDEARQQIEDARAATDTTVSGELLKTRDVSPSASALLGATVIEESIQGNVGAVTTFDYGTQVGIDWRNQRQETSALFQTLSPAYTSSVVLSLTQPLLRGAWSGRPEIRVQVAEISAASSVWDYRGRLAGEVKNIISTYWRQQLAQEDVEVKKRSLKLAERLLEEADAAVKVGLQAPLAVNEARSQVAARREELIVAENALVTASNELRRVLGEEELASEQGPVPLKDKPAVDATSVERKESIEAALRDRPEVRGVELRLKAAELNLKRASNGLLPELNLVGSIGVDGLAGSARSSQFVTEQELEQIRRAYGGGYGESLDKLGTGDFYTYTGGVRISYPLENRRAKSQYELARLAVSREKLNQKSLSQRIVVEVQNAIGDLESARQRVNAANEAKEFAIKSYETGEERYRVGLTTTREILELQADLAAAELALARALVDFQVARAEILRARGEILQHYNITVDGNA